MTPSSKPSLVPVSVTKRDKVTAATEIKLSLPSGFQCAFSVESEVSQLIWHRLGIDMPRRSLCGLLLKVSELCEPLVKLMREHIIVSDYAQADETTVQVLDEIGRSAMLHRIREYISD